MTAPAWSQHHYRIGRVEVRVTKTNDQAGRVWYVEVPAACGSWREFAQARTPEELGAAYARIDELEQAEQYPGPLLP